MGFRPLSKTGGKNEEGPENHRPEALEESCRTKAKPKRGKIIRAAKVGVRVRPKGRRKKGIFYSTNKKHNYLASGRKRRQRGVAKRLGFQDYRLPIGKRNQGQKTSLNC